MEKYYQHILGKLVVDSGEPKPAVSFADVAAAAARMGIEHDDLQPLFCYLLDNGCKIETPDDPEDEKLLRIARLSKYDEALRASLQMFFSGLNPSDKSCIDAMEYITIHLARLNSEVRNGVDYNVLQMKREGLSAVEIAQMLEKPIEEIYSAKKRVYDAVWKTHPQRSAHNKFRMLDFYAPKDHEETLEKVRASANGDRIVLTYEQFRAVAEQKHISEESLQDLADYLIRHGCIILSPDGELRMRFEESRFRHFRTEENRLRYYASCGEWPIRTSVVNGWYKDAAKDEKDALHKERFMKHLKRDDLLTSVYSMREQNLSTRQIAQELGKDPGEIAATDERIWNLYKASFPV